VPFEIYKPLRRKRLSVKPDQPYGAFTNRVAKEIPMRTTIPFPAYTDDAPLMHINTTPLIDVLLVLLITLIVNLPLGTHAVNMDLGQGGTAIKRESVRVDIESDGSIYWNDTAITDLAELERRLRSAGASPNQPDVRVNANGRAKYDTVAKVLAAAQRNGVRNVAFVGNERFID
jgi:biopolymer transport protein ExbD